MFPEKREKIYVMAFFLWKPAWQSIGGATSNLRFAKMRHGDTLDGHWSEPERYSRLVRGTTEIQYMVSQNQGTSHRMFANI